MKDNQDNNKLGLYYNNYKNQIIDNKLKTGDKKFVNNNKCKKIQSSLTIIENRQ